MSSRNKAFTLIEMLIVIVIIGILAAALVPRLQSIQAKARNSSRLLSIQQIWNWLHIYKSNQWRYPTGLSLLWNGIMNTIPSDPQAATNSPCYGLIPRATWSSATYLSTWVYLYTSVCAWEDCIAYNGFVYGASQSLNKAFLGARVEKDGSKNAHGNSVACNRVSAISWETNGNSKWDSVEGAYNGWLVTNGSLYLYTVN